VQLIGGMALHEGKIAEMRTGEGKTLMATLPAYLNALPARACTSSPSTNTSRSATRTGWARCTASSGSRRRDQERPGSRPRSAPPMPATSPTAPTTNSASITCATTWRTGSRTDRAAQAEFAIVDEVDSILIDEARTPLIISGPAEESTELYHRINELVPRLTRQKSRGRPRAITRSTRRASRCTLTEDGHEQGRGADGGSGLLREGESLYDAANIRLMHHLNAALRAHALYKRDVEYIVRGGEVIIVDEFTGRTMPGRRWSDGLHQAVEAKEGVRSARRTRPSPRSRSRIISGCTRSSPA
jgi:preprotein translocase subunit SecA